MRLPPDAARRLILLYAGIVGLAHVLYALPGAPYYPDNSQGFWLLVDALLVWRLYRGSRLAWVLLVALNLLPLAAVLFVFGDVVTLLVFVEIAALLAILFSKPVRSHVSRRRANLAPA